MEVKSSGQNSSFEIGKAPFAQKPSNLKVETTKDQEIQDKIKLSRAAELADRISALPESEDFAEALKEANDEVFTLAQTFGRYLKGQEESVSLYSDEKVQEAIRQTVEEILGRPHPQKGGRDLVPFATQVYSKLDRLTND